MIAEEAPVGEAEASPVSPAPAFGLIEAPASATFPGVAAWLVAAWLSGAVALLARSIVSTRRFAADPSAGPALVGVLRPRLVLPADFMTRFDAEERSLIFAHEALHGASGHTVVNGAR